MCLCVCQEIITRYNIVNKAALRLIRCAGTTMCVTWANICINPLNDGLIINVTFRGMRGTSWRSWESKVLDWRNKMKSIKSLYLCLVFYVVIWFVIGKLTKQNCPSCANHKILIKRSLSPGYPASSLGNCCVIPSDLRSRPEQSQHHSGVLLTGSCRYSLPSVPTFDSAIGVPIFDKI